MENVLLFFGGKSYEHDISIVTASQIYTKTKIENIKLIPIYLSKTNRLFFYDCKSFNLNDFSCFDENKISKKFKELFFVYGENGRLFSKNFFGLKEFIASNITIIACHGGDGENGKFVAMLEKFGIYSQSGSVDGLSICMNKFLFKKTMQGLKIPVVKGQIINKIEYDLNSNQFEKEIKTLGFPVVLKPNNGGSSIGLFVAKNGKELNEMISQAFEFDDEIVVEKFIDKAKEFNVAVVGDKIKTFVSEIDEPLKINEILSFEDKYLSGTKSKKMMNDLNSMVSQKRKFPAELPNDLASKMKSIAIKIFKSLNLSGVVRVDFLFDEKNNKLYVCEVNAVPGSLSYYFFSKGNVSINDFVNKLIDIAKEKKAQQENIKIDYITKIL